MQQPREAAAAESSDSGHSERGAGRSSAGSARNGGSAEPMALGPGDGTFGLLGQCCCLPPTECAC